MRRLRVVYSFSRGGVPVLVMASLIPTVDGCSRDQLFSSDHDVDGGATDAASDHSVDGLGDSAADVPLDSGGSNQVDACPRPDVRLDAPPRRDWDIRVDSCDPGAPPDPRYEYPTAGTPRPCCDIYVDLPPEGTPAFIESVCVDDGECSATSGWAARATLGAPQAGSPYSPAGHIAIARALADRVVGLPRVALIDASLPELRNVVFSDARSVPSGFAFDAHWTRGPAAYEARITLEVTFAVRCNEAGGPPGDGPETTRTITSLTNLIYCAPNFASPRWVSSGDICNVCAIIAEMAPTPIVPGRHEDPLPLGEALRLNVKTIARIGRSFILLAEHDGGSTGHRYAWRASAGELLEVADDIVVWTPPEESMLELVQVAVESSRAAGVASLRWDRAA